MNSFGYVLTLLVWGFACTAAAAVPAAAAAPAAGQSLGCLIEPDKVADLGSPVIGVLESIRAERGDSVFHIQFGTPGLGHLFQRRCSIYLLR